MTKKEIGTLLKNFRETNHYSASQVVTALEEYDVNIALKTYYGYEAGTHKPSLDVFFALCKIYKYDILELICEYPDLNKRDMQFIHNYQSLDATGKSAVNALIKYELERTKAMKDWREKAVFYQKQLAEVKKNNKDCGQFL